MTGYLPSALLFLVPDGAPRALFLASKVASGTLFEWPVTENPFREVATKDYSSSNPHHCGSFKGQHD